MYIARGIYISIKRVKWLGPALALPTAYAVISALPRGDLSPSAVIRAALLALLIVIAIFGALSIASWLATYKYINARQK